MLSANIIIMMGSDMILMALLILGIGHGVRSQQSEL